jgi:hypothetical protein
MKHPEKKTETTAWEQLLKPRVDQLTTTFNAFPHGMRKLILGVSGVMIAMLCAALVFNAIDEVPSTPLAMDKIALPKDIYMEQTDTIRLIPIGKMKGEIDGEFEAFYLAIDKAGQVYLNREPGFGEDQFDQSKGWQPVTREQLSVYEKELHFIPHRKQSLKP